MSKDKLQMGMPPVHPGEFIVTEILSELGLSTGKAARVLGVPAADLSELVNERASISPEMAMRIELAFDVNADLLLRMQALYDGIVIRSRAGELNVERYTPV